ncbi:hypothetical protein CVT26_013688 [Gymnopilus dilepis]|uniref:Uncharacterized protein n=1 Tax=Gymnopilus dilepis TaxID=231916 RepID=A0A409YWK1_9AGAR|nr:hypothetical protein CVT26_013688 [Gymnopilus dilepis]
MGVFDFFSSGQQTSTLDSPGPVEANHIAVGPSSMTSNYVDAAEIVLSHSAANAATTIMSTQAVQVDTVAVEAQSGLKARRFSLRSFSLVRRSSSAAKPAVEDQDKRRHAQGAAPKVGGKGQPSRAEKRVQKSALTIRSVIVGPLTTVDSKATPAPVSKSELSKIKSQLLHPAQANKLIAQLRQLPAVGEPSAQKASENGPIHAVCLDLTDAEEHLQHFSKLAPPSDISRDVSVESIHLQDVMSTSVDALINLFKEMHIVNLLEAPNFGLGQPGDGDGLLAGAVPTAETVINGVRQLTPELMALGYATGKAIVPDHSDFEFDSIKQQDKGRGVVCAATWIMPAAMVSHPSALRSSLPDFVSQVPRPWDFPSVPPKNRTNENNTGENQKASPTEARPVNPPPSLPKPAGQPYSVLSAVATPSGLKASPPVSPK